MKNAKIKLQRRPSPRSGFTLIELMVALGVFSTIVTIVSSIFIGTLRNARFVSAQAAAVDNAGLIIEQIAREVRTGSAFVIPANPDGKTSSLQFTNYHNELTTYSFDTVPECEKNSCITKNDLQITSQNVIINGSFYITKPADTTPRITVVAMVRDIQGNPLANLQTTVSARLIYYKTPNP